MKKTISFALVLLLLLSLTACSTNTAKPTDPTTPTGTVPTDPEQNAAIPYLLNVENHDEMIFSGPTYDSSFVDTVREAGVYTIVEEKMDDEGITWGKLKSGSGWLDLTQVAANNNADAPLSAGPLCYDAPKDCLLANEATEFSIPVILHAYGKLTNVRIYSLSWDGETYEPAEHFYMAPEMNASDTIVAHLEFPGDMSMYGVSCQDEGGTFYHYQIVISGRNGALIFAPYDPNR